MTKIRFAKIQFLTKIFLLTVHFSLLTAQLSFAQLTASFPDSSFTFFSETQTTQTTIPIWILDADTSHQAISFDFNFYYKFGDLQVSNVEMIPSGTFEFSVNPDGQNENEIVSGAGVLNSELIGDVHLFDVTFEIPTNLASGFEKKINWVNFRFTPNQPQINLENGVLTLAKNGDLDKSNVLDSTDAIILLDKIAQKSSFSAFQSFVSDFDGNGKIQAFDGSKILEFVKFGQINPDIFSFTTSNFEGENFAVNSIPYSFKLLLNGSVSINSLSAKIRIPSSDFVLDSVKVLDDFSSFVNSVNTKDENGFIQINFALASENSLLNGDLELLEVFLTPSQVTQSTEFVLSQLVTNVANESDTKSFEIEIIEYSNNDTLDLIFSDSLFSEMNENFELSLFTPRISSFWQIENLIFEIHFPTSKFNLESFTSPYFEDLSRRTEVDKIEIRGKTTQPKDFTGNLFEFVFSSNNEQLLPKDQNQFEIKNLTIASNFPFQFIENQASLVSFKKGDLNADNSVDSKDFSELIERLSLFGTFDEFETKTVDFDNSETVSSFDASLLLKFLNSQNTNISKNFEGSHNFIFPNTTLNFESFTLKFFLLETRNVFSASGKISWNESDFKLFKSNFSSSDTSFYFAWNDFGFCFASQNQIQGEVFELELLPLKEGDLEILVENFEINGIQQPSQIFLISVKKNSKASEMVFGFPYPNPNKNGILSVNIFEIFDEISYEIFNTLGQEIIAKKQVQTTSQIEIPLLNSERKKLANGVYFLTLEGKTETKTKKVKRIFTILR